MLLTDHKINPANDRIDIDPDERDPKNGNASHFYQIVTEAAGPGSVASLGAVQFQRGPIAENGINGVTNEALLAIVIDRLRGFQSSQHACRENACALTKLEEAMHWLHSRTRSRMARGVEGTSKQ
jgi:hypothetical protein